LPFPRSPCACAFAGPAVSLTVPSAASGDTGGTPSSRAAGITGFSDIQWTAPTTEPGHAVARATRRRRVRSPGNNGPTTVPARLSIDFYGTKYSSVYINNNGNLTFSSRSPVHASDLTTFGSPIIRPFFADVDTARRQRRQFRHRHDRRPQRLRGHWPGVGCYGENDTVTDNFQVILIDRPDRGAVPTPVTTSTSNTTTTRSNGTPARRTVGTRAVNCRRLQRVRVPTSALERHVDLR